MIDKHPEKLKLIVQDEKVLRQPSEQVDLNNQKQVEDAQNMVRHLQDILYIDPLKGLADGNTLGCGLSACQIKSAQPNPLRVSIIRIPQMSRGQKPLELSMINSQIIDATDPFRFKGEGCLSFPGKFLTTRRHRSVKLGFVDAVTLEPREIQLYGLEAVVVQHEIDHQNGVLFFDHHMKPVRSDKKIGPNNPCPCGSNRKYKKCCQEV